VEPELWRRVEDLYHRALQLDESRRAGFLENACGDDHVLRHEVESLLAREKEAENFIESPALEVMGKLVAKERGNLEWANLIGSTVSHYMVIKKLGAGGMGVVYEAVDVRLQRRVALKFLPDNLAHDPRALQRFKREAHAASSLNHPSICTIYEVEEHDGQPVIVMELLEGQSLKERTCNGPLPTDELLELGIQTSDALAAAHTKGIIHRDIKPANIFVAGLGRMKILDFGLAKAIPGHRPEIEPDEDSLTMEGVIPGTTAYMSPEQIRGEEIDARSDLFSLGVVLYEAATGKRPFVGKNRVLMMNAILNEKPVTPSRVNSELPAAVDTIIMKALEKDREQRYQHASEMRADLQGMKRDTDSARMTSAKPAAATGIRKRWSAIVPASVVVLAFSVAISFYFRRTPKLTNKDTIILADFTNTTGDPVFDGTLRQGMTMQLEQSPFLSLVSEARIQQTLRLMGQPADTRLTPEIAREVCERTASAAVLDGSIASLGSQYVLGLRANACRTGDILDAEQVQAARKEDVLNSLSHIASRFRTRVGESLATVEKYDTPLAEATTPSLEALKAYSAGWKVFSSMGHAAALPLFKRAVELDSKFAMAHASLGRMYSGIEEPALSAESVTKAYQLRDRASEREKFFITANYDLQVTGDLEKAQQTCELWAQAYPRDALAHGFLGSMTYLPAGRYEKAIEETRKAIELDPDLAIHYAILALSYQYLDRLGEAENTLQRAAERHLEIPDFFVQRYDIAFLKGDKAGMERAAAQSQGKPGVEDWVADHEAFVLAYSGHLQQARRMSRRAVDLAQSAAQQPERAALYEAPAALWEGFFGNAPEARRSAMAALELSKELYVEFGAAFALALAGDSFRSQTLVDDLERRFGEDTSARFSHLPALRALLALNHGEPAKAIELLQTAVPYDLSAPRSSIHGNFGALYPIYVRGEAYLALHQGAEAATEFQKILDHRGIVASDPIGALAHLQLGRAYAMQGDTAKAKAAYQDFLTLWKDADLDVPVLKDAKAEYATLR
jgi:eukaryotic-like serine/threonine-protein kinase